ATLKELISQTMVRWSQEDQIQDPELVRIMYSLLRRQYDSIGELLQALRKAYTISAVSVEDTINLLAALGQIRSLLSVRMGKEEELLMINGLGYGIKPFLLRLSKVLCYITQTFHFRAWMKITVVKCICHLIIPFGFLKDTSRFHRNFQHDFTEISKMIPSVNIKCIINVSEPGTFSDIKHLNSFSLYLSLMKDFGMFARASSNVVTYLAGCGLQSCPVLLAKGYPDIGWNPIEGERYLSFLRFAVFVNSESVEENASVVVKLLIR
ncbi:RYR3 protein, partial [Nothocercus julius]|nr:RYR3 protein [Nothocercus julius]